MQKIMRKKSNIADDKKFDGQGVDFKSKLIGVLDVSCPRGDDICQEAISDLKASALKELKEKKEHKQKITINITIKGIRLIDDATERIDHAHPIHRISFISHDKDDKRTFGYIVGTKEGYKLFALKTTKEAEVITATLKDLFQEVFKRHQAKKEETEEEEGHVEDEEKKGETENETDAQIEAAEDALESKVDRTNSNLLWDELNDQIKEMQQVGIPHSDSFDMLSDPFRSVEDGNTEQDNVFGDNFSPDQNNLNPFDEIRKNESEASEKIDFFALPSAEELKRTSISSSDLFSVEPTQKPKPVKSSSYSEDLYAIPNPPSRNPRNGLTNITNGPGSVANGSAGNLSNGGEPALMKHDPFHELKKNINELHKQNIVQQQQMQQMTFTAAFPNNTTTFQMPAQMHQPNAYTPSIPNPFTENVDYLSKSLQPGIPTRPAPTPVIPARPSPSVVPTTNPFMTNQQPQTQTKPEPDMGWSILQPTIITPPIKDEPRKTSDPVLDPFSFLNEQSFEVSSKPTNPTVNGSMVNEELLDLLG